VAESEAKGIVRADIVFEEKDQALREDVHRRGTLVGELVREQGGEALFDLVEAARRASIQRREGDAQAFGELKTLLGALAPSTARDFIRAFSTYFQMVNMAEKVHRIRRRREYLRDEGKPQPFGFLDVLERLKAAGIGPADIEDVIRQQIGSVFGTELSVAGGIEKVAEILNNTSRSAERSILDAIRERNSELAAAIKSLMFVFDDLVHVNDRDLQRILVEVEQRDLAMALKATSEELKQKLLSNVSERAAALILEEMDLLGPVRIRDVEEAQRRIIEAAQMLEDQEEITLSHSGEDLVV